MKRMLALLLLLTMCLSVAGVGLAEDDIYEVVMQFPTLGSTPEDLQLVEDAINARTEPEIGVHVTLFPATAFDLNTTTNLMVSSNEKLDLAMCMFEGGVASYVNKGALLELDDLVAEYGQDIVKAEGLAMSGGYFNGKLYAVPTEEKMGRVKAFLARRDLLEKYGIEVDPEKIYTYADLTEIFATVKAGEGEGFYCVAANGSEDAIFTTMEPVDTLGSVLASGCLMNYGVGTTEVVNYYETQNFRDACASLREWYVNGYLSPDCNTITDSSLSLVQSGNYLGLFNNSEPDMIANIGNGVRDYIGTDVVPLYVSAPAAMTQFYQLTLWMIPITCDNPVKTMQWLNMMYADKDIINLLYRGIEGKHYVFTEGSEWVVDWPEGVDGSNVTYMAILNVWGDKMLDYVRAPLDESYYQAMRDFNASIKPEHTSAALGYCFNSANLRTQLAAVSDVVSQYQTSLGLGVVDPDQVIPEFLEALKAAGVDDLIAENQKQFDEWLAAK